MQDSKPKVSPFNSYLDKIKLTHQLKGETYGGDRYCFEKAEELASWFDDPVSKGYAYMIGIKLARIAFLERKIDQSDGFDEGDNTLECDTEALKDSYLDKDVYNILWTLRKNSK